MPYVENFRYFRIYHVETSEISPLVEKFSISPQFSYMESWNFFTWQFFLHEYNSWYSWQISGLSVWFVNIMLNIAKGTADLTVECSQSYCKNMCNKLTCGQTVLICLQIVKMLLPSNTFLHTNFFNISSNVKNLELCIFISQSQINRVY